MLRRRALRLVVLLTPLLAIPSCGPEERPMGIGLDRSGRPIVLMASCDDDSLFTLTLGAALSDRGQHYGDVLWRVTTEEPVALDAVTIGDVPEGLSEDVPLEAWPPASEADLVVEVTLVNGPDDSIRFEPSDLVAGRVFIGDGTTWTPDRFDRELEASCTSWLDRMKWVLYVPVGGILLILLLVVLLVRFGPRDGPARLPSGNADPLV